MSAQDDNRDHELESLLAGLPAPAPADGEQQQALRRQVLDAYDRAVISPLTDPLWQRTIYKGVVIMSHPISRTIAALAAVLVVAIWLATPRQSIAFGDFLAPIVNAKTARFAVSTEDDVQYKKMTGTGWFLAPSRFRQEFGREGAEKLVSTADFERGRMMSLIPETKEAVIFELSGQPDANKTQASNFFGNLRTTLAEYRTNKKGQLEELGEKDLDGRRAFGFRLISTGMVQTLWGDATNGHLLRVESTYNGPPKTEVVMSDFEFDMPLEDALFSTDPPEGYKAVVVPIDATPPTEKEFITVLGRLSDALDGQFPSSLDTPGIVIAMAKLLKGKESQAMMREGAAIGKGLMFAMQLPVEADAHYAGKGAKRDGPQAPIFWYKPTGAEKFRVIYNNLSASDVDTAPDVPDAIRMVQPIKKSAGKNEKTDEDQEGREGAP